MAAINFEAVLAIPLYFIRDGAKLKMSDLLAMANTFLFLVALVFYQRMPKWYFYFLLAFGILLITGILGPAVFRNYMYISAAWFFLSFTSAYAMYDYLRRQSTPNILKILGRYLSIANVIFGLALFDYVFTTIFRTSIFPHSIDQRMHQLALGIYRFEGFSPLSLAFVPIGFFHFMLALLLKRRFSAGFHLFLILLSVSIGGMVAGIIAYVFLIFGRLSYRTKWLLFIPIFAIGIFLVAYLVNLKIKAAGKWSYGVRLELYFLTPTILENDKLGMGFGQSRYLYYSTVKYNLKDFETLYNKARIELTFVVESSHLEVIYEFGYLGLAMVAVYTLGMIRYGFLALRINQRNVLIPVSIMLFFYVHAFFNPSYFYQTKFWLYNMICLLLVERFRGEAKLAGFAASQLKEITSKNLARAKALNNLVKNEK